MLVSNRTSQRRSTRDQRRWQMYYIPGWRESLGLPKDWVRVLETHPRTTHAPSTRPINTQQTGTSVGVCPLGKPVPFVGSTNSLETSWTWGGVHSRGRCGHSWMVLLCRAKGSRAGGTGDGGGEACVGVCSCCFLCVGVCSIPWRWRWRRTRRRLTARWH